MHLKNVETNERPIKTKRGVLLPKQLKEKLDTLNLTRLQREKAIKFLSLLIKESTRCKTKSLSSFIPRPRNYLRKAFNSRYSEWLDILKREVLDVKCTVDDDGIIRESYRKDEYSKSYRIREEFLSIDWEPTSYIDQPFRNEQMLIIAGEEVSKQIVYNDLRLLYVNDEKLKAVTDEYVLNITPSDFKIDEQITTNYLEHVEDNCTGYEGPSTTTTSVTRAKENGMHLIQDGDNFYVDDIHGYIIRKKRNVRINYYHAIKMMRDGSYYADRNETNHRLDHNLTALPSLLLDIIKQDNDLKEIDLINSQYAILAFLMQRDDSFNAKKDYVLFRKLTSTGKLYEYIQDYFQLGYRSLAKEMMMTVAFSSYRTNTPEKLQFKELFPSVVKFIDDYKKSCVRQYGKDASKRFAIWLQETEAEIFVDNIYTELKKKGIWCLTRHDSVIVRHGDALRVYDYMIDYFKRINFNCSVKMD